MQRTIFTDEHEMFRDAFRQFVDKEIVPDFLQWEADGIVPRELFSAAGASGFLGMDVAEQYGGGGVEDFRYNLIIGEELQRSGAQNVGGAMNAGTAASTILTEPHTYTSCPLRFGKSASMASCTRPARPLQASSGLACDSTGTR